MLSGDDSFSRCFPATTALARSTVVGTTGLLGHHAQAHLTLGMMKEHFPKIMLLRQTWQEEHREKGEKAKRGLQSKQVNFF